VIATSGRPTITTTLSALTPQLEHGDEILILRDSTGDWGHTPRNNALPRCNGTHLMFIDDDDHHLKGALEYVREEVAHAPDRVHLFAMAYSDGRVVHPAWPLQIGYVDTSMLCVPNTHGKLGRWGDRYEGDYDFIASTIELRGDTPILHDDVIATKG
jgi:hypothetical protein